MPGIMGDIQDRYKYGRMRANNPDPFVQKLAGPLEHREFVREMVADNPLHIIGLAAATPAYTGLKALAQMEKDPLMARTAARKILGGTPRSPASLDEMFAAVQGAGMGIQDRWEQLKAKFIQDELEKEARGPILAGK